MKSYLMISSIFLLWMQPLTMPGGAWPYFVAYTNTDIDDLSFSAELVAIEADGTSRRRMLDVDARIGDYELDSSHKISGGRGVFCGRMRTGDSSASLDNDSSAIKRALWLATDREFKAAANRYQCVLTNLQMMIQEEDQSADFSREEPQVSHEPRGDHFYGHGLPGRMFTKIFSARPCVPLVLHLTCFTGRGGEQPTPRSTVKERRFWRAVSCPGYTSRSG